MKLTIFTPAYNRAELLPRLYNSLLSQENGDFEWLVVDDGSTDDTEAVVGRMTAENKICIRYLKKENGGKHTAHNLAVDHAAGEWFFCVDSDDILADGAVTKILTAIENAPDASGFAGYKADTTGKSLCGPLPSGMNCGLYTMIRQGGWGEYALIFQTSVLRKYRFPVISGERFVTESVLYDRLELEKLTVRSIDQILEICEYQPGGLSSGAYRLLVNNPAGYQIYHAQRIDLVATEKERIRHCICYQAFYRMSGNRAYRYRGPHRLLAALAWLPGLAAAWYYRIKGKRST